jgi:hypothetical protein
MGASASAASVPVRVSAGDKPIEAAARFFLRTTYSRPDQVIRECRNSARRPNAWSSRAHRHRDRVSVIARNLRRNTVMLSR